MTGGLSVRKAGTALGAAGLVIYLLCILLHGWAGEAQAATRFLETVLPGFRWLTPLGFLIGAVESALYGFLAALVLVPIYSALSRRGSRAKARAKGSVGVNERSS